MLLFEGRIFQMLADIKQQQAQSDRCREQAALDRERVTHEQEGLKQLNYQLQAQIDTLREQRSKQSQIASMKSERLGLISPSQI